ncbi:MAG TPA: hypothetical protein VHL58_04230 [Thermoanaerobaculia bacterium]|nr:hypothetical protein [Thermoanaerobaculia bacterium]
MTGARRAPAVLFALSTLTIVTVWWFLLRSSLYIRRPDVAVFGAAFDLLVSVPLIYYFLVVRRGSARASSLVGVVAFSLMAAAHIIPAGRQPVTKVLPFLIAPVELLVIALVIGRIRMGVRQARQRGESNHDPIAILRTAASSVLGDNVASEAIVSEIANVYYALFAWRRKPEETDTTLSFHKESGWSVVMAGFILAIVAESTALHLLLFTRAPRAAWVLTALDLYGILWLIGDAQGFRLRRTRLRTDALEIEFGMRWRGCIDVSLIEKVERVTAPLPKKFLKLMLLGDPEMVIHLREPITFSGMYGLRKTTATIAVRFDDAERFEGWARERQLWSDPPPRPDPLPVALSAKKPDINREEWLRRRPDYIPLEDWIRSLPPE